MIVILKFFSNCFPLPFDIKDRLRYFIMTLLAPYVCIYFEVYYQVRLKLATKTCCLHYDNSDLIVSR